MRTLTIVRRLPATVAALVPVVLVVTLIGAPVRMAAAAPARAAVRADIDALGADAARVGADVDGHLRSATSTVDSDPCGAADGLLAFARRARAQGRELEDLARRAASLRGRVLVELAGAEGCEGPVDVHVDAERAAPLAHGLPGFDRKSVRPLATLVDTEGAPALFVANELILSTSDSKVLGAFLDRWGGRVLQKLEPNDGVPQYLVLVDASRAHPEAIADDLAAINDGRSRAESLAVSSEAALRLLAAAAASGREKLSVGVNWVTESDGFGNGQVIEASNLPSGLPAGWSFSANAYDWEYLKTGGSQDIGVTGAWTVLDSVNKLKNKVRIAVLDRGFATNVDSPPTTMVSTLPLVDPSVQFPTEPRWHGTWVGSALSAVPGNFGGSAGPAGPVATQTYIWTTGDMFLTMSAIDLAIIGGNRIVNMSFGLPVPWPLAFTVLPFDLYTAFVRATNNVLIFASAGNDGKDVDATTGWLITWEKTWFTPCENSGVICVGGLAPTGLSRDPESNFGHEDVDIFAPYSHLVGPDPHAPDLSSVRLMRGTSLSSPYTAGVAALIWAAAPSLSADAVEDILLRNMRTSPDPKIKRRVITALAAVQDALPATIAIQTPTDGTTLSPFSPTTFEASVFSDGHGTPTVTWRRNGVVFGVGPSIQATVPAGNHVVTATATFPDGATTADTVNVSSVDHVPTVHIASPKSQTPTPPTFDQSELIPFHATSLDDLGPLADSQLRWYLDTASTPFATGHNPTANTGAAVGNHTVTLIGCDAAHQCGSETIPIAIQPDGTNRPPTVHVTNPTNGALLWVNGNDAGAYYHELTLAGTVSDPEGAPAGACGQYHHHLVLRATDNAGNVREDAVDVTVSLLC